MAADQLIHDLYAEIVKIPLIDPHSHIDPHRPTARSLDEILGYHYYTELAHSAGMDKALLTDVGPASASAPPRPSGPHRQHRAIWLVPGDRPRLPRL